MSEDAPLEEVVRKLAREVAGQGGRALLVGGGVRDVLLGEAPKDFDLEVFGLEAEALERTLSRHFRLLDVGRAYGVLKISGYPIDVSLPRRESKIARGHRGFAVATDPDLSLEEAAVRRDLTVNALYRDPLSDEILDPLGGLDDLRARLLRHCSEHFSEDPLRVLRIMQFTARFEFAVHPDTVALCAQLDLSELPRERVGEEWRKLLCQGRRPTLALEFLAEARVLRFFPELESLHDRTPELWRVLGAALDAHAASRREDESDWVVGLATLCHLLEEEGARSLLARLTRKKKVLEEVERLRNTWPEVTTQYEQKAGDPVLRRLSSRARLRWLLRVARHHHVGQQLDPEISFAAGDWLRARAETLQILDGPPPPILKGRHLLTLGIRPGAHLKPLLERCYERQLDGEFATEEEGLALLRTLETDNR